jgi:hypothetical protein
MASSHLFLLVEKGLRHAPTSTHLGLQHENRVVSRYARSRGNDGLGFANPEQHGGDNKSLKAMKHL